LVVVATLVAASFALLTLREHTAGAQETDPTPTTGPPPDPPPEPPSTTAPPPDPPSTTAPPPDPSTTEPPTDTTEPPETSTSIPPSTTSPGDPPDLSKLAGTLDPSEALVPRPEFGTLSSRQRALVQQLQTATDAYALRRFALVDIGRTVADAERALRDAQAVERAAVERELFGLADAANFRRDITAPAVSVLAAPAPARTRRTPADERLTAFRAVRRHLQENSKAARLARERAQSVFDDLSARLTAQQRTIADALAERADAEAAIERELGPGAVRARPDAVTATLAAAQSGQPDPLVIGGIGDPLPGSSLSSPFGLRNDPLGGGAGFHPGVDLTAGSSPLIRAAAAGVVVTAGGCGGYGYCVVIDHGTSLATLYGHQSQVMVQVGEHVDAGEVIGRVGSTGMSTGPHLHFEVRLHGLPIDPVLALFNV
jgi:murein DD-endopeptidase MepM/ murein hydrolase activator NlpD